MANDNHGLNVSKGQWAVRGIIAFIGIFFLISLGWKSGDKINKPNMGDHYSGDVFDLIGLVLFIAGLIWISGLADYVGQKVFKKDLYKYGNKSEEWTNTIIGFVLLLAGFLCIRIMSL